MFQKILIAEDFDSISLAVQHVLNELQLTSFQHDKYCDEAFLKIRKADLVSISNAQNYVEIFYLENNQLRTKLIRSSLKKVQEDFDFLLQIHRSHLINPLHFKSWRNSNTIILTQIELPVSKNYKASLLTL